MAKFPRGRNQMLMELWPASFRMIMIKNDVVIVSD